MNELFLYLIKELCAWTTKAFSLKQRKIIELTIAESLHCLKVMQVTILSRETPSYSQIFVTSTHTLRPRRQSRCSHQFTYRSNNYFKKTTCHTLDWCRMRCKCTKFSTHGCIKEGAFGELCVYHSSHVLLTDNFQRLLIPYRCCQSNGWNWTVHVVIASKRRQILTVWMIKISYRHGKLPFKFQQVNCLPVRPWFEQ